MRVSTEALTAAAADLSTIGGMTSEANTAAALPTTAIVPAGADEISAAIAQAFGAQGQQWQQLSAVAQDLYQRFVLALAASAAAYQQAEADIAGWLSALPGALGSLLASGAVGLTVPGLPPDGSEPLAQFPPLPPPPFLQ